MTWRRKPQLEVIPSQAAMADAFLRGYERRTGETPAWRTLSPNISTSMHNHNFSYATMLTSASYIPGVRGLACGLVAVGARAPLLILATSPLVPVARAMAWRWRAANLTVRVRELKPLPNPYRASQQRFSGELVFSKLRLWTLIEYEQLLYLDADVLPLASVDHLFGMPSDLAAAPAKSNPWLPPWGDFNSGVLLVRPSLGVYKQMMQKLGVLHSADGGDQGFLQSFFRERLWTALPVGYNWPKRLETSSAAQVDEALLLHFTGPKPWSGGDGSRATDPDRSNYPRSHGLWWRRYEGCLLRLVNVPKDQHIASRLRARITHKGFKDWLGRH